MESEYYFFLLIYLCIGGAIVLLSKATRTNQNTKGGDDWPEKQPESCQAKMTENNN